MRFFQLFQLDGLVWIIDSFESADQVVDDETSIARQNSHVIAGLVIEIGLEKQFEINHEDWKDGED